ncbi:MAG TPA: hypothetical protein VLF60_02575 [Candidatus Saccharimonadales bacterium]|nr:hypothetical protein [Candidatus Saccharimonadales bacterium]
MSVLIDACGFVGAACLVFAYLMVTTQHWSQISLKYHLTNLTATGLLLVYSLHKLAYANALLNVVWLAVAIFGVYSWTTRPKRHRRTAR